MSHRLADIMRMADACGQLTGCCLLQTRSAKPSGIVIVGTSALAGRSVQHRNTFEDAVWEGGAHWAVA
jgi:hypothetical protein